MVENIGLESHPFLDRLGKDIRLFRQEALHGYSCHCVEIAMILDGNGWAVDQAQGDLEVHQTVSSAVISRQ